MWVLLSIECVVSEHGFLGCLASKYCSCDCFLFFGGAIELGNFFVEGSGIKVGIVLHYKISRVQIKYINITQLILSVHSLEGEDVLQWQGVEVAVLNLWF